MNFSQKTYFAKRLAKGSFLPLWLVVERKDGKVKVCCFCERWASGGIESFLYNILLSMDLSGFEIDVVVAQQEESIFSAPLKACGVNFYELSGKIHRVRNYMAFWRILRERRYDVLYLNAVHGMSLFYARLAMTAGVPIRIAHSHNTDLRQSLGRSVKLLLHRLGRKVFTNAATDLWACSSQAAEFGFDTAELKKKGFSLIPNGIDTEKFRFNSGEREAVRRELGINNKLVIGNVGRLCRQKNQAFLLDIFAEILRHRSESCLLLVGDGEEKEFLRQKAERLGIVDKVIFYGVAAKAERLFWAMDVFLMPSIFEGLPVVVIEAQAAGLPVVSSEAIPNRAMITTNQFRRLSLSESVKTWAEATLAMRADDRSKGSKDVSAAGFEMHEVAGKIRQEWMRQAG